MDNITKFHINGKECTAGAEYGPNYSLSDYIREVARLRGTKVMCREGACGLCTVTVSMFDPTIQNNVTKSINACLCPIHAVDGWHITTIEGIGNKKNGYHPIQERIVKHFGTQCGFCTPGFVMNMYGYLCNNPAPNKSSIESAMDGNICRCTGYRSIMDAMKSFAKDEPGVIDIEDLHKFQCSNQDKKEHLSSSSIQLKRGKWYSPSTLDQLYALFDEHAQDRIRIVFGNTGAGVYKGDCGNTYINIRHIPDLCTIQVDDRGLVIGANISLHDFIHHGKRIAETNDSFWYIGDQLAGYFQRIGNATMRNAGSWAGNLMLKHKHPEFPSDLTPIFEALGCRLLIGSKQGVNTVTIQEFLDMDMNLKVIISIGLPPLPKDKYYFKCHKIMSKAVGTYAIVNAGCLLEFDTDTNKVAHARIAYGGLSKLFNLARCTSEYLNGKHLTQDTIQGALNVLETKLILDEGPLLTSVSYRKNAAIALLYRFLQSAMHAGANTEHFIDRPVTSGEQLYENITNNFPINNSVAKYNALLQASGEAEFVDDIAKVENELTAVPVLSTVAKARIASIDVSEALAVDGVVRVIKATDIPGKNDLFRGTGDEPQEILASEEIRYSGQPVAVILAANKSSAHVAARLVKVTYADIEKPIIDIEEAIKNEYFHKTEPIKKSLGEADEAYAHSDIHVEGEVTAGSQYHFFLEPQSCLCVPTDEGMDVYPSTQDPSGVQTLVCDAIGEPHTDVHISVKRIGGGFGGKNFASRKIASLCAISAKVTDRPVRMILDLNRNIEMQSKRFPLHMKYKVGVNRDGRINAIIGSIYLDIGNILSPMGPLFIKKAIRNINGPYTILNWKLDCTLVKTDIELRGPMRGPAAQGSSHLLECMVEHVAHVVGMSPVKLKELHLCKNGDPSLFISTPEVNCILPDLWREIKETAEVEKRLQSIDTFNKQHKWRKKGLAMVPMRDHMILFPTMTYPAYVCIYAADGTVGVSYGGVEMGQGLHTKVSQICAKYLGVPMEDVKVNPLRTDVSANTAISAASLTLEMGTMSVMECCKILMERLRGVRAHNPGLSWKELVQKAHLQGIDLAAHYRFTDTKTEDGPITYNVYGVAVGEAEVDILTGEHKINRLDVLFDPGESLNPEIDVGQVEGALISGLGYMVTEKEIYHPETGRLLTNGSWEYKVPLAKEIPVDMRINIRRNIPNPAGVSRVKAIGEPPIMMTPVFYHAIKRAVLASRLERGLSQHFKLDQPATSDSVHMAAEVRVEQLC